MKIKHTHDVGMHQTARVATFIFKKFDALGNSGQSRMQYFYGNINVKLKIVDQPDLPLVSVAWDGVGAVPARLNSVEDQIGIICGK